MKGTYTGKLMSTIPYQPGSRVMLVGGDPLNQDTNIEVVATLDISPWVNTGKTVNVFGKVTAGDYLDVLNADTIEEVP